LLEHQLILHEQLNARRVKIELQLADLAAPYNDRSSRLD